MILLIDLYHPRKDVCRFYRAVKRTKDVLLEAFPKRESLWRTVANATLDKGIWVGIFQDEINLIFDSAMHNDRICARHAHKPLRTTSK